MPKSTQTRFLGIRDNHNHYMHPYTLAFLIITTDLLMSTYSRQAIDPWSVLDLHVGEINVLPISNFYIIIDYL